MVDGSGAFGVGSTGGTGGGTGTPGGTNTGMMPFDAVDVIVVPEGLTPGDDAPVIVVTGRIEAGGGGGGGGGGADETGGGLEGGGVGGGGGGGTELGAALDGGGGGGGGTELGAALDGGGGGGADGSTVITTVVTVYVTTRRPVMVPLATVVVEVSSTTVVRVVVTSSVIWGILFTTSKPDLTDVDALLLISDDDSRDSGSRISAMVPLANCVMETIISQSLPLGIKM